MKNKFKTLICIISLIAFSISQINAQAIYIYSAKSRSLKAQENLTNNDLPSFRYDRNNIELNTKEFIDLLVEPDSKTIKLEIISAESNGLGIDSTELLKNGLKILRPKQLRTNGQNLSFNEEQKLKFQKNKPIIFNLKNLENQLLIIDAIDFKIFRPQFKGLLPGSYVVKATVDGTRSTTTTVVTKADFRLDAITPSAIEIGIETTLTFLGKGLDSLTKVFFEGTDIEVRGTESLDDKILKVKAFAKSNASPGFRDVSVSNFQGKTVTIINGLLINGEILTPDNINITVMDGMDGVNGINGIDGMGICNNALDTLKVFTNNLPPGSQSTVFFDPVLCNLTFGIPVGFNGVQGNTGSNGSTGTTGTTGASGTNGTNGINCWDTNGNGTNDSSEDINNDGVYNALDCQGLPTVEELIANWDTLSNEQDYTTSAGVMARMVKIPKFRDVLNDGVVYGGFWVDKYEASRSDATATAEGSSSNIGSKRNVVPYANISLATAQSAASASGRQISGIGSCKLIGIREWQALYILGRYSKISGKFSALNNNGWDENGNTRSGKDGRNSNSFKCTDDPVENLGGTGRCLTGTGFKSWGHLLDASAITNVKSGSSAGQGTLGGSADSIKDDSGGTGADTFDGDLQVYDLVGNIKEFINFTVTRASGTYTIDTGFPAASRTLPFTTNNSIFNFSDLSQDQDLKGLGLPADSGSANDVDIADGAKNSGKIQTNTTNQTIATARGGAFDDGANAPSPLTIDLTSSTTTTNANRGFRAICDFP